MKGDSQSPGREATRTPSPGTLAAPRSREDTSPMQIAVASGKGGTGKTTVATGLALVAAERRRVQFLDCDVEAPNAHVFLSPQWVERQPVTVPAPEVDASTCTHCGTCARVCAFGAVAVVPNHVMILPQLCHGCGGCIRFCPTGAMREVQRKIGTLEKGTVGTMLFAHGVLEVGEAISSPLIAAVRAAVHPAADLVLVDAPPGTSCPVLHAINGVDYCLLVTEPTPFGMHDLDLAVQAVSRLGIPAGVLINRADVGDDRVERYCRQRGLPVLMRIPWDAHLAQLYAQGRPVVRLPRWRDRFRHLLSSLLYHAEAARREGGNR